jgi:hypothetical protein
MKCASIRQSPLFVKLFFDAAVTFYYLILLYFSDLQYNVYLYKRMLIDALAVMKNCLTVLYIQCVLQKDASKSNFKVYKNCSSTQQGPYSQNFLRSRICVSKTYVNLNKVWYSEKKLKNFLKFLLKFELK